MDTHYTPAAPRLSLLDLSPVPSGSTPAEALHQTLDLARFADEAGYHRYWMSEHHNTALLASSAPEVMIGHVASITHNLRVGSGGIMLPNHAPLKIAETFRTLEALHPGRIDLGLGRAPGTDPLTAVALRRSRHAPGADDFPQQFDELMGFFAGQLPDDNPFRRIVAIPQGVAAPEVWMLGSSDYGAIMAAQHGLGFAFAHHISPSPALRALRLYYERFEPSQQLAEPHAILAVSAVCAPTDEEAETLASSADLAWLRMNQNVRAPLPSVEEATHYPYTEYEREFLSANRERLWVGSPQTLHERLTAFTREAGVTEIMITTLIHDHEARRRSYGLLAEAFALQSNVVPVG